MELRLLLTDPVIFSSKVFKYFPSVHQFLNLTAHVWPVYSGGQKSTNDLLFWSLPTPIALYYYFILFWYLNTITKMLFLVSSNFPEIV